MYLTFKLKGRDYQNGMVRTNYMLFYKSYTLNTKAQLGLKIKW